AADAGTLAHARSGRHGMVDQDLVEDDPRNSKAAAWRVGRGEVEVDLSAGGGDPHASQPLSTLLGHRVQHAQIVELFDDSRAEVLGTGLFAWEGGAVKKEYVAARPCQARRGGRAGRAGADDDHIRIHPAHGITAVTAAR